MFLFETNLNFVFLSLHNDLGHDGKELDDDLLGIVRTSANLSLMKLYTRTVSTMTHWGGLRVRVTGR